MAFRLYRRSDVFRDNLDQVLAGGTARFYEAGTTTPLNVFSDEAMAVNLGSEETLDTAGRFATGIWGDGDYRVRFYDEDDVLVSEDDPITDPAGVATTIPSLTGNSGKLLTNNGAVLQWIEYLSKLLPDMTGQTDKLLTTDGTQALWKSAVEAGLPNVDDTDEDNVLNLTINNWRIMAGSDEFPIPSVTPPHGAVRAITFPTAFATAPFAAFVCANKNSIASHDYKPIAVCEVTNTTLTAQYNINENSTDSSADVSVAVPFSWFVIGIA